MKVLSASPHNPEAKRFAPGTILHISDSLAHVAENPEWKDWNAAKAANQRFVTKEPTRYIKKVYAWMIEGKMFYPEKARVVLDNKYMMMSSESVQTFPGPFIFTMDLYEIGRFAVKGNPWL
jgi:hypothetical protein